VQAGLTAEQVDELAGFLLGGPPQRRRPKDGPEPAIELKDPNKNGMLTRAAWTTQGMLVSVVSAAPPEATPNEVELDCDQAQSLGSHLSKGSPRPALAGSS
jgi:hypothetical protein